MKTRAIIFIVAGLLLAAVAAIPYLIHRSVQSRSGPSYTFMLSERPRFLTEELALASARDALNRDGYNVAAWQPTRDGRTDEFMARNVVAPNRSVIIFTNTTTSPRIVSITLDGSRVICQIGLAK